MIKSIFSPMTGRTSHSSATAVAVKLTKILNGQLSAYFMRPDPRSSIPYVGDGLTADVIKTLCDAAEKEGAMAAKAQLIASEAQRLLAREKLHEPVRLLGVGGTNLGSAGATQLALFGPDRERQRRSQLNRALDEIVDRFGPSAVARGGSAEVSRAGLSFQIKRGEEE